MTVRKRGRWVFDNLYSPNLSGGYLGEKPGRDYYVNNISGDDGQNGLSWDTAVATIAQAITLAEAYRELEAANNQYVRNRIFIQGTATAYASLTTMPSYCDIIGIGSDPFGNGAGIARIGADSDAGHGVKLTDTFRGVNFYNLQFQAGNGKVAFGGTNAFRSNFYHCCFATNGSPGGEPDVGFQMAICGGVNLYDCLWQNQSSLENQFVIGLEITSTHFHGCKVEDCFIGGDTGVKIAAECITAWGSRFKDCYIGQLSETCDIGVDDNATVGHIIYQNCAVQATDAFALVDNQNRIIGCYEANAFAT